MDFVKKNWGLIVGGLVALGLAVYMLIAVSGAMKAKKANLEKIDGHMAFFKKLGQFGYDLERTDENGEIFNLVQSRRNFAVAEEHYNNFIGYLRENYKNEVQIPENSSEALRLINAHIEQCKKFLAQNGIVADSLGGSFSEILESGALNPEDFNAVFRGLNVMDRILANVAAVGIKQINYVVFPMGFAIREEAGYTVRPLNVSVNGTPKQVQDFINVMTDDPRMLFYITDLAFSSPDVFTEEYDELSGDYEGEEADIGGAFGPDGGGAGRGMGKGGNMNAGGMPKAAKAGATQRQPRQSRKSDMGGMDMPGAGKKGAKRSARNNPDGAMPGMGRGAGMGRGNAAMPNADGASMNGENQGRRIVLPPKRQDWLIFGEKEVEMNIRFDLYEFIEPQAEAEEDSGENGEEDGVESSASDDDASDDTSDEEGTGDTEDADI